MINDTIKENIAKLSEEQLKTLKEIEELENTYLEKYYYFLKFVEREILLGLKTKDYIKDDWFSKWGGSGQTSDFAVGAERIVYALLNGKGIGQPNSCPVGADLMFEVDDAMIHIDMKTVCTDNIGDCTKNIFVGENQNSYKGTIVKRTGDNEQYIPNLPYVYTVKKENYIKPLKKLCLSYFIVILYDKNDLDTLYILITSMPNGLLEPVYGSSVLAAGKNPGKARYNFSQAPQFALLKDKLRTRVIYLNDKIREDKHLENELKEIINLSDSPFNK